MDKGWKDATEPRLEGDPPSLKEEIRDSEFLSLLKKEAAWRGGKDLSTAKASSDDTRPIRICPEPAIQSESNAWWGQ